MRQRVVAQLAPSAIHRQRNGVHLDTAARGLAVLNSPTLGGIEVSIRKLAIYTAAGGIDPKRVIPVMLDVGTNRQSLLDDPIYIGNQHPRVRGERYDAFIDAYVKTVTKRFPKALLQWEDLAPGNGRRILEKYRGSVCTFNDDVQGTGAITLAAVISALRAYSTPIRNQRVVIFGAGTAGIGVADQLCDAMVRDGLSRAAALRQIWCVDRNGLLTAERAFESQGFQVAYARHETECRGWKRDPAGLGPGLAEVVRRLKPTILIGAAAAAGSFTEAIVKDMATHTERPIIFVLSQPAGRAEATPADLISWTDGRALVAIVARASHLSEGMFAAAASAVSSMVTVRPPGCSLLPQIHDLRAVAMTVAETADAEGLAGAELDDIVQPVHDAMWQPEYRQIRAL